MGKLATENLRHSRRSEFYKNSTFLVLYKIYFISYRADFNGFAVLKSIVSILEGFQFVIQDLFGENKTWTCNTDMFNFLGKKISYFGSFSLCCWCG